MPSRRSFLRSAAWSAVITAVVWGAYAVLLIVQDGSADAGEEELTPLSPSASEQVVLVLAVAVTFVVVLAVKVAISVLSNRDADATPTR
ncbi:MAG: hypothetical protein JWR55_3385 [Aeromicrobium sp.]|jgi:hypothetical protein|nr:hypothetical protein [Aeromicrobium sp.]